MLLSALGRGHSGASKHRRAVAAIG